MIRSLPFSEAQPALTEALKRMLVKPWERRAFVVMEHAASKHFVQWATLYQPRTVIFEIDAQPVSGEHPWSAEPLAAAGMTLMRYQIGAGPDDLVRITEGDSGDPPIRRWAKKQIEKLREALALRPEEA